MADNVFANAVSAAAKAHGSTQAVASLLRVPEGTLLRWMGGRAMMPVRAFIKLMEFLTHHEQKLPPESAGNGDSDPVLTFSLGTLMARCTNCEGAEFMPRTPGAVLRYSSILVCRSCNQEVAHSALLTELATLYSRAHSGSRGLSRATSAP